MNSLILALHVAAIASTGPETSQQSQQNEWSPWFGCWQAEGAPAGELICIKPTNGGVVMATVLDGKVQDESTISADGLARRVQQQDCRGTERARWSKDGQRVFLDSDVSCGANGRRVVRGMFAFVAPNEWISVQSATAGDSVATRLVRFVAANPVQPISGVAAFTAGNAVSEEMLGVDESDVAEAVEHLGASAAQEWMRESGEPFQLGYDDSRASRGGSALDQVGRFSNSSPVVVREVVRVVERPVYVYDDYYYDHYRWHYSPWGYRYYGWHWWPRPVVVVHLPIVIFGNSHYRRDYYHYRTRWYDYDRRWSRNDNWRRDRDWSRNRGSDNYREDNGGRVTRGGYSNDRNRARSESATAQIERTTSRPVATGTDTRTRTATPRARTSEPREQRTSEAREQRTSEPREQRASEVRERSSGSRERVSQSRESGSSSSARSSSGSRSGSSSRGSDGGSRSAKTRGSR
jgi:hypothetical protein